MAQLFLNIRAGVEASKPGAEPKSRRAVTRPHGRRRLLRREAEGAPVVASSRGAARATLAAQRTPAAGGPRGRSAARVRDPKRPRAPAARRGAARRRPRAPLAVRPPAPPSLAPGRNMAAAAASASQDELSKCGAEPAAVSGIQLQAGPGPTGHWRPVWRGAGPAGVRWSWRAGSSGLAGGRANGRAAAAGACRPQVCTVTS